MTTSERASRISVMGEALKSRLPARDEEVQKMLGDIAGSSRRLVRDMSDIVWSLDPRRDQIGELASRLRAFGSDLLETRGVEWTLDAPLEKLHHAWMLPKSPVNSQSRPLGSCRLRTTKREEKLIPICSIGAFFLNHSN